MNLEFSLVREVYVTCERERNLVKKKKFKFSYLVIRDKYYWRIYKLQGLGIWSISITDGQPDIRGVVEKIKI